MKKHFIFYFFIFFCSILLTGCFEKKLKDVNIGIERWYPPFSYEINGDIKGLDIDLLRAILSKMGYRAVFKVLDFNKIESALENGEIDIAASGLSITKERLEQFDFSKTYYKPSFAIIYKRTKFTDFISLDQFQKMTIGAQQATVMEEFLSFIKDKRELLVKTYTNNFDLINSLKDSSNDVNAIIVENLQAEIIISNDPELDFFVISGNEMSGFDKINEYGFRYAFGFKKGSKLLKKFNKVFDEFDSDGKIDILKLRWFSSYGAYSNLLSSK